MSIMQLPDGGDERNTIKDSTSESEEAAGPDGPSLKAPLDIDFDSL